MNDVLTVAVAKLVKEAAFKKASANLDAGEYPVDTVVRIKGTITKGESFEQVEHMAVPQWAIIAILLSKLNGVTMEAVIREALSLPEEQVTAVKESAAAAIDTIKTPAKKPASGKVTADLVMEEQVRAPVVKELVAQLES